LVFIILYSRESRHTIFSRDWSSDVCSSDLRSPLRLIARTNRVHADQVAVGTERPTVRSHLRATGCRRVRFRFISPCELSTRLRVTVRVKSARSPDTFPGGGRGRTARGGGLPRSWRDRAPP